MSPVFRHGGLRLYLLKLLDEAPRHGYEVIRLLQDRFMGVYAPSPGTIYPRLARLEEEGLVTHDEVDGKKVYRITDKGREEIESRLDDLAELEEQITASVRDIAREVTEDVRDTVRNLREELTWAAGQNRGQDREQAREDPRERARRARDEVAESARRARDEGRQGHRQRTGEEQQDSERGPERAAGLGRLGISAGLASLGRVAGPFRAAALGPASRRARTGTRPRLARVRQPGRCPVPGPGTAGRRLRQPASPGGLEHRGPARERSGRSAVDPRGHADQGQERGVRRLRRQRHRGHRGDRHCRCPAVPIRRSQNPTRRSQNPALPGPARCAGPSARHRRRLLTTRRLPALR